MMPRHLSANWQYSRQAADGSGRFHSAPQLGQVVLSSSLHISSSPPQTWQLIYAGLGCNKSRSPGHVSGFLATLSLELNDVTSYFHFVFFNWDLLARAFNRLVNSPFQASAAGYLHVQNGDTCNVVLLEYFS